MRNNYKRLGDYIEQVKVKNKEGLYDDLRGINIDKFFMPSVANVVGVDLTKYKIIKKNQFACNRMHVGRDYRIPIALSKEDTPFIVSPAYDVFEIIDNKILLEDYLMMWFSRKEFDRNAWYYTDADVRGGLAWDAFCNIKLPIPPIEKQRQIVAEYNAVDKRIRINEQLNQKLEETAQALYKHWFVDFEADLKLEELIQFNPRHTISKGEKALYVEMSDVQENSMNITNEVWRKYKSGTKFRLYDTLLARITPCLENGKTAFVNNIPKDVIAFGSTEFIVMRARKGVSPFWVYCLAKDEDFRNYAISSMIGSSGRQRVHSDYLKEYKISKKAIENMQLFHKCCKTLFSSITNRANQNKLLKKSETIILSKMAKVETHDTINLL